MKYNVLVIAGTTESRQVIEKLLGENPNERILASVATELGKEMLLEYDIDVHVGRLDQDGFLALLKENPCEKIIDASHPFAKIVSETVKKVADELVMYDQVGAIVNRLPSKEVIPLLDTGDIPVLSYIENDTALADFDIRGENVFYLPEEANIVRGVREAVEKLGI